MIVIKHKKYDTNKNISVKYEINAHLPSHNATATRQRIGK